MTFIEKLVAIAIASIILVSLITFIYPFGIMENYSDGQRTGDIYKFSKKGLLWKSWEGEMYLGGYHSTGGENPTIETDKFYFSIDGASTNTELIEKLQKCSQERQQCTVVYREWLVKPWWLGSGYVAVDVLEGSK